MRATFPRKYVSSAVREQCLRLKARGVGTAMLQFRNDTSTARVTSRQPALWTRPPSPAHASQSSGTQHAACHTGAAPLLQARYDTQRRRFTRSSAGAGGAHPRVAASLIAASRAAHAPPLPLVLRTVSTKCGCAKNANPAKFPRPPRSLSPLQPRAAMAWMPARAPGRGT